MKKRQNETNRRMREARHAVRLVVAASTVLAAALAVSLGCSGSSESGEQQAAAQEAQELAQNGADVIWTCSMHPQVRQNGPGKCPICGMDLIPVAQEVEEGQVAGRTISFSNAGMALMEIETTPVTRRRVDVDVELVGKVTYDAGRVATVSAWVPGRIEKLHVDHVGEKVEAGQPIMDLYGPELMAAQRELVEASSAYRKAEATGDTRMTDSAMEVLAAVRERLKLWGISDRQVADIEARGTVEPRITVVSPVSGVVVWEQVIEGAYVSMGQKLLTIADLSVVWIDLEAHETDLAWLTEGLPATFHVEALPGHTFHGSVVLVEPVVDPTTRTVVVRIEADNKDGALKPDMFVRAVVTAPAGSGDSKTSIVIPSTAPLLTGKRAVVYVQVAGAERPTFEGREVVLGPRAGDYYVVVSGLAPGERVVTNGAFKIDSALEIRAMPSMMSPDDEDAAGAPTGE
jgi:Cu(I)/Ag(I) efflux system membrane fusion protein